MRETRELDTALEDRVTIEPFGAASDVRPDEVLAFWRRERAVPEAEARRRVHEVHLVAVERDEGVVGVSSAYLQRNAQLEMDLWHYFNLALWMPTDFTFIGENERGDHVRVHWFPGARVPPPAARRASSAP